MDSLFGAPDFAWSIRMRTDEPGAFYRKMDSSGTLLQERRDWLEHSPEICVATSRAGDRLVNEAWNQAVEWGQVVDEPERSFENLGRQWEADFIFLDSESFQLAGGCVCFPSSWSLQESVGRSLEDVHDLVPGLNPAIGDKIRRFLERLAPGQAFLRENWGMTRTCHLNYHPSLGRDRLDETVSLGEVFLRIEHQVFTRLPSGVMMGVRIEPVSLENLIEMAPETARRLRRQLETMPAEVAVYKSLDRAIERIVELIDLWMIE